MEQADKQQEIKYTITSYDKAALKEFNLKRTLFETMTKTKSIDRNPKHMALYHALIESILEDEDVMDKGTADMLKKRKPDDADRDEDPPARSDQGLKRKKTIKNAKPSKKEKSTDTSKGTTKSQPKTTCKSAQAEETGFEAKDTQVPQNLGEDTVDDGPTQIWLSDIAKVEKPSKTFNELIDWNNPEGDRYPFDLSKPLPLVELRNHLIILADYFFNNDLAYLQRGSTDKTYTTSLTMTKAAKHDLKGIEDMRILVVTNVKVNKWYGYGHLEEIEVRRADQQLYKFMEGDFPRLHLNDIEDMLLLIVQKKLFNLMSNIIVDLAAALRVESYQKKLNISKPRTRDEDLSRRALYTTHSDPQGVIYEDKLNSMHSDELHKFSDSTL
ncbi:hypothetical protein Tco_0661386 [Tanacetum coccineum]